MNNFKYLVEEFASENLELLKQIDAYPYKCMGSFGQLMKKNYLPENIFLVQ